MRFVRQHCASLLRAFCYTNGHGEAGAERILLNAFDSFSRCTKELPQLVRPVTTLREVGSLRPLSSRLHPRSQLPIKHLDQCYPSYGNLRYSTAARPALTGGPWISLVLTAVTGGGLVWYYNYTKQLRIEELNSKGTVVGQSAIGGPFELVDHNGKTFTEKDLLGEFALLYFGFTYCPDICPDELEKVAEAVNLIEKQSTIKIQPVFITVDPERDGVAQVKEYVKEFHPRLVGLTGSMEKVKEATKAYRVYFTKTNDSPEDYLVDHSIITYLLNPDGQFVTFYGKNYTADEMAASIQQHVTAWKTKHPAYPSQAA